jgi:hypothetical protein
VDFGELKDMAIKGLMDLSKIVSRFYLYIHEQLLKDLFMCDNPPKKIPYYRLRPIHFGH